jgi:uncharacterized protein YjaZ
MKINVVFLKSENDFSKRDKNRLQRIIKETTDKAAKLLKVEEGIVNFVVYPLISNPLILKKGGIHSQEWIELILYPSLDIKLADGLKAEDGIRAFTYHEMHHLARGFVQYRLDGQVAPLIDAIFSEGLAIAFEEENVQGYKSPYSVYQPSVLQKWLPTLRIQKESIEYDYNWWFEQSGIGYRIGKYFVDLIFARYPYLNSASLVRANLNELLDLLYLSGINLK